MLEKLDLFGLCYIAGFVAFIVIRGMFDRGSQVQSTKHGNLALERLVMVLTGIGLMVLPIIWFVSSWLDSLNYTPHVLVRSVGIIAMACCLLLFWRAHRDLGRSFSRTLEIHVDHKLVTGGIYRFMRHPIYAAIWLFVIAQAMLVPNWGVGLGGVIGFGAMYVLRTPREERMMRETFGPAYDDYARQTGRLWPKLF
jgi:protein-S-isoprenylcysteine O-methyltransferase Ste14